MIDVINLKKSFGKVEVLKGIDITINKGDVVVVIGPSGSGKSTFLRCLNCMEDPTAGNIIFNGVDIADPKVDIKAKRIKDCNLSTRTRNICMFGGIETLGDLCRLRKTDWLKFRNSGKKSLAEVDNLLHDNDRDWAEWR